MPGLTPDYSDLHGDALLERLREKRNVPVLEAMWRAEQPELCVRLVDRLLGSGDPFLAALVADEVLNPRLGPAVDQAIATAIQSHKPRLAPTKVDQLIARLRDPEQFPHPFPGVRHHLEGWALAQPGRTADDFAVDAACCATPTSSRQSGQPLVRQAAYARASDRQALAERIALALRQRLLDGPSSYTWLDGSEFVEALVTQRPGPALVALVQELVRTAADLCPQPFGPRLAALAASQATTVLHDRLAVRVQRTPGSQALVAVADGIPDVRERQRTFLTILTQQPELWPDLLQRSQAWSEDEWAVHLDALRGLPPEPRPANVGQLLTQTPNAHARAVIELAAHFRGRDDAQLQTAATNALRTRLNAIANDVARAGEIVAVLWWPDPSDESGLDFARWLLDAAVPPAMRTAVLANALNSGAAPTAVVAALVREQGAVDMFAPGTVDPSRLPLLVSALHDRQPAHVSAVTHQLQAAGFRLELATGLAAKDPGAAFDGAEKAYDSMTSTGRDELLALLEAHGTPGQRTLLERFATNPDPAGRPRRARALTAVARMLPKGAAMPPYYAENLTSSVRSTREATLDAIALVAPRDRVVLEALRNIAGEDGPSRAQAGRTLDTLVDAYLATLDEMGNATLRIQTVELVGAAGRPRSIDPLLGHLGEEAVHDAVNVHRAAAKALSEAARYASFTPEQVDRLGALLDGEGQEADPEARRSLEEAFALASLGEDKAFAVLGDLLGFKLKMDPQTLFGAETKILGRALSLIKNDESRGRAGWPLVIMQLDIAAERITRAAYLVAGDSEPIKEAIRNDPAKPDFGSLIRSLQGRLSAAEGPLLVLHDLRCTRTEYSHPGQQPTEEDVMTAKRSFREAAKVLVGTLQQAAHPRTRA